MPEKQQGSRPSSQNFAATPRTASFSYGEETVRAHAAVAGAGEDAPVAILICHGMGQQVRFETIGQVAASILTQAEAEGCTIAPNGIGIALQQEHFLARAELNWTDPAGQDHAVHVYEAYWAPVTEGKVTYAETLQFLLQAAWRGLNCSRLFRATTFDRWIFGDMRRLPIFALTKFGLLCVAAFLLLEAGSIAFVGFRVAAGVKEIASTVWPSLPPHEPGTPWIGTFFAFLFQSILQLLKPFLPEHQTLHHPGSAADWFRAAAGTFGWLLMIGQAFFVRYFLIEYAGDVAAYISPYKDSKFESIRTEIQTIGLDVARVIYGFDPVHGVPRYRRVVVAGHSLGSVLAYDTLNAIFNLDLATGGSHRTMERTSHLITFGSPLDKTAFLFRNQSNHITDPIREQMSAGMQPLIRSYEQFRKRLTWINIWSKMDIISGSIVYYDTLPETDPMHVQNKIDPGARIPLAAHVQYWKGKLLGTTLYDAVK